MTQQEYIDLLKKKIANQNIYIKSLEYYKELWPEYINLKQENIQLKAKIQDYDNDFIKAIYDELMRKFDYKLRMQVLYDHADEISTWIQNE